MEYEEHKPDFRWRSGRKVSKLLAWSGDGRDIADPWYTGNFDETYDDVLEGCEAFLTFLLENGLLY